MFVLYITVLYNTSDFQIFFEKKYIFSKRDIRACDDNLRRKAHSIILTKVSNCVMRITQLSQVLISNAIFDEVLS